MTDASGIDENTGELRFGGPDFDAEAGAIHILSNAQVAVILQASANNAMVSDQEVTDAYNQALKYVDRFNQMANKEKDNQGTLRHVTHTHTHTNTHKQPYTASSAPVHTLQHILRLTYSPAYGCISLSSQSFCLIRFLTDSAAIVVVGW